MGELGGGGVRGWGGRGGDDNVHFEDAFRKLKPLLASCHRKILTLRILHESRAYVLLLL